MRHPGGYMGFAVDEVENRVKRSSPLLRVASIINIGWSLVAVKRAIRIQVKSSLHTVP